MGSKDSLLLVKSRRQCSGTKMGFSSQTSWREAYQSTPIDMWKRWKNVFVEFDQIKTWMKFLLLHITMHDRTSVCARRQLQNWGGLFFLIPRSVVWIRQPQTLRSTEGYIAWMLFFRRRLREVFAKLSRVAARNFTSVECNDLIHTWQKCIKNDDYFVKK